MKIFTPFILLLAGAMMFFAPVQAQLSGCAPNDSAGLDVLFAPTSGGTNNRSGLVFHPTRFIYYSINAGNATYPIDTYDAAGNRIDSTEQGFDYRGLWWNPVENALEGNGFSNLGIFVQNLNPSTGLPLGTGSIILPANQPDNQSIGDLDPDRYEIVYYRQGVIHRYSREDNSLVARDTITGLPISVSDINSNTVMYTGCPGHEYALYSHTNRRVLYVDKSTNAYSGATQLPSDAPQRGAFGVAYANGRIWIFNSQVWRGYKLFDGAFSQDRLADLDVNLYPNPTQGSFRVEINPIELPARLELYSPAGRLLFDQQVMGSAQELDASSLPDGVYVVKIAGKNGYSVRRLVKSAW